MRTTGLPEGNILAFRRYLLAVLKDRSFLFFFNNKKMVISFSLFSEPGQMIIKPVTFCLEVSPA